MQRFLRLASVSVVGLVLLSCSLLAQPNKLGPGTTIMAGLEQGTSGRPQWILNYERGGKEVLSVHFDAATGNVTNVFPRGK